MCALRSKLEISSGPIALDTFTFMNCLSLISRGMMNSSGIGPQLTYVFCCGSGSMSALIYNIDGIKSITCLWVSPSYSLLA